MNNSSRERAKTQLTLKPGQIVECRGGVWRFIQELDGFWELELIKHGASFAESSVRVWALPGLESEKIAVLGEDSALCPSPHSTQLQEFRVLKPMLAAHRARSIHVDARVLDATTALNCAIDHKSWQFEPWKRIVETLPFPRLLIADDVGLGKTTEAAIILAELSRRRRADRVMIVAPQHLCEKWQNELFNRFGLMFEIFTRETRERLTDRGVTNPWEVAERVIVSRDFVKRWENFNPLSHVSWDMIVIDECHHFVRDDSGFSTRLRDFAEKIALKSPGLLLLSATPFTGSKEEFRSLISLLDPQFSDEKLSWQASSAFMVRRLKKDLQTSGEVFQERTLATVKIQEGDLSKNELACFEAVEDILSSQTKGHASAETWRHLQIETLRKRLSSSWQAFYETCSDGEIAKWFDESTSRKIAELIEKKDSAKLRKVTEYLQSIHKKDRSKKVVVFTEAIASQVTLFETLVEAAGYTAQEVRIIKGETSREERLQIEDDFANQNSKLIVLIATDTISEGKDLQHSCHHLIHFELPWSLVRIEQRNGRIDRLGQKHPPQITNVVLDLKYTPDQRVLNRLADRMSEAQESLGSISPILEQEQLRFADLKAAEKGESGAIDMARIRLQYEELGIDMGSVTPLSPTPINHRDDSAERRALFDLMITRLGGGLIPNGKNTQEGLLWLPEERWPLPNILIDSCGYPTREKPWRITFSGGHYLAYEKHLLSGGAEGKLLQFLSPIHPVILFAESRFRFQAARKGYPVFSVRSAPALVTIVAELTLRSPKGRVISQSLEFLDQKTLQPLDPSAFGDLAVGPSNFQLPTSDSWKAVGVGLRKRLKAFEELIRVPFASRKSALLKEHSALDQKLNGISARREWIEELWSLDSDQSQYQILGIIVSEARS